MTRQSAAPQGLRERKKARTRAVIRQEALRLFREQGYAATTVEQIAAEAEVSPSTFFRYFPTKEDVVLQDDFDTRFFEAFDSQPPELGPVAALRASFREAIATLTPSEWDELREMAALGMSVPEIRARMLHEFSRTMTLAAEALARRYDRSPEDLEVRVMAGTVFGTMMAVMNPDMYTKGDIGPGDFARMDEALGMLESGLPM
ncbi:MAG TPA: TetR family transcriptional regulator [Trebonia sp.]|jgi:AcrR family transcriptional regulator